MNDRNRPNILITGTPGTGKTSLASEVASLTGFSHINVGDWVREKTLHSGWDEEYQCYTIDDDKVRLEQVLLLVAWLTIIEPAGRSVTH